MNPYNFNNFHIIGKFNFKNPHEYFPCVTAISKHYSLVFSPSFLGNVITIYSCCEQNQYFAPMTITIVTLCFLKCDQINSKLRCFVA